MTGRIHSFFAGGTVDGPGIRFVIFLMGCPLRCKYCHNPDTWNKNEGDVYTVDDIVQRAIKYKKYFGDNGGVTVTGGEPLLQIDFVIELFKKLKKAGIHTAVDTSGYLFNDENEETLYKYNELNKYTDLFLLDIKHIDDDEHKELTGVHNKNILKYAKFLSDNSKPMWVRHVLIPGITLNDEYLYKLNEFIDTLSNVVKVDVLPYHTMGITKYQKLNLKYPLEGVVSPTKDEVIHAKKILGVI